MEVRELCSGHLTKRLDLVSTTKTSRTRMPYRFVVADVVSPWLLARRNAFDAEDEHSTSRWGRQRMRSDYEDKVKINLQHDPIGPKQRRERVRVRLAPHSSYGEFAVDVA